jgi:hypothetical protein
MENEFIETFIMVQFDTGSGLPIENKENDGIRSPKLRELVTLYAQGRANFQNHAGDRLQKARLAVL